MSMLTERVVVKVYAEFIGNQVDDTMRVHCTSLVLWSQNMVSLFKRIERLHHLRRKFVYSNNGSLRNGKGFCMKVDKKSLTKPVNVDELKKQKSFDKFLKNVKRGDEVWEWKVSDVVRLGAAGGFVIVRNGEPTEHVMQTYTG
jgi:hypothetical protein